VSCIYPIEQTECYFPYSPKDQLVIKKMNSEND